VITVFSGGTGTPKLLQGIKRVIPEDELNIVVNTLENNFFSGVYVSADIDTVLYTMCDLINEETWYGRKDDTFTTHETLAELGLEETLRIGDKDRALKIQKTLLLDEFSLTDAVRIQKNNMGIKANILPMSNEQSNVTIDTDMGTMGFHEFLISHQSKPLVKDIIYESVTPTNEVLCAIEESDQVIIGPSNPITSINPILIMPGIRDLLKKTYTTSVSPIIGEDAVSGPAAKFMKAKNVEVSPLGIAKFYEEFLDHYIINTTDNKYKNSIKEFIPEVSVENIIFKTLQDKINLAQKILGV